MSTSKELLLAEIKVAALEGNTNKLAKLLMALLHGAVTEESTDELIELTFSKIKVPFYLKPFKSLLKKGLDLALPGALLQGIEKLLKDFIKA